MLLAAPPEDAQSQRPVRSLRGSLKASVAEGMVAEVFTACAGATVLTAWAVALRLSPFFVGLMTALPFFAQFVQFPAAWLTSTFGHRRVALTAVCLSRQVMLPLALMPWLPLDLEGRQHLLLAVAGLSAVLGVIGNNAWVSWMGELVPSSVRGRYFGKRTAMITIAGTLTSVVAGFLLDGARRDAGLTFALPLLAALACAVGLVTTFIMARQHDPAPGASHVKMDLRAALLPVRDPSARKVLLYQVAWNAGVGLSAPFFAFHMLKNLKMTFVMMALQAAAVACVRILTAPLWGKLIDRVGAQPVLLLCSLVISTIPALWLLPTEASLWPLAIDVVLNGAFWAGHGLAAFARPLSVAPRRGRPVYLAAFATAGGLAYAAASALGGGIAGSVPTHFTLGGHAWVNFHVVFMLSALARLGASFLALRIVEPGVAPVRSLRALMPTVMPRLAPAPIPVRADRS
ncbi:MAG TPA: MFS transporter [Aggregicoccus sp.]|nr:MFS transporter [Aggregicoccus sp.]